MNVIRELDNIKNIIGNKDIALALGYFDGLHKGHLSVIDYCLNSDLSTVVFSFTKNNKILINNAMFNNILLQDEKIFLLNSFGVDSIILPEFNSIKNFTAEEFFYFLINNLNIKLISCGFNYHFGKNAIGDTNLLKILCQKNKIKLNIASECKVNNITISSTNIKSALNQGNIKLANKMLGYNYFIESIVIKGKQIGRTLGFPTINQSFNTKYIPKYGIYASNTFINNKKYKSITNIGIKPTIIGDREPLIESFILDFNGDLYDKKIKVELIDFIRCEEKFNNLQELKTAISNDLSYYN